MLISSIDSRLVYGNAKATMNVAGVPLRTDNLSNSYLQLETPVNQTQTAYQVPITITQQNGINGQQSVVEQRLELQDSFFISHMGYFLKVTNKGGYTGLQDQYFTFPSTALLGAVDIERMQLFWDGFLKLTVNNKVICPQWDLQRHLVNPQAQRPIQSSNVYPWQFSDQRDGASDGFYPVEPNWVLIGSRNNQLQIEYPRPFDTDVIPGSPFEFRAVIILRGVLAQNSTTVR